MLPEDFYAWISSVENAADHADGQTLAHLNMVLFHALHEYKEDTEKTKIIKETITKINFGLVHFVCKPLYSPDDDIEYEDLFQAGVLGLLRAIEKYDPSRGIAFSSYAVYWIKAMVYQALSQAYQIVHLPRSIVKQLIRARRLRADYLRRFSREPTVEDLRFLLSSHQDVVPIDQLPTTNRVLRLDREVYEENKPDLVHSHIAESQEHITDRLAKEIIHDLIETSDPVTAQIVQRRFAFPPYRTPQDPQKIAKDLNMSVEEVQEKLSRFLEDVESLISIAIVDS